VFKEQFSLPTQFQTVFYIVPILAEFLGVGALVLIDSGLSRSRNALHTSVQKLVCAFVGAFGFAIIGYGIWEGQYNQAFGISNPFGHAISDWWIFGHNLTSLSQNLNPEVVPAADQSQLFFVFFIMFAALISTVMHIGVAERMKTLPLAVCVFVFSAIIIPIFAYLIYGPVGWLSNHGAHEYAGSFFYLLAGTWSIVLAWRLGPRIGAFSTDLKEMALPHNLIAVVAGVGLLLTALMAYVLGNGFLVPGGGFFGVQGNETSIGRVFVNATLAIVFAGLGGIGVWRLTKNIGALILAPVAGFIASACLVDIATPAEAAAVGFLAPFCVYVAGRVIRAMKIDDAKLGPLAFGAGLFGCIAAGFIGNNVTAGGIEGGVSGYAFGHAHITIGWQLLAVGVFVAGGLASALVTVFAVEKVFGLRERADDEEAGLDLTVIGAPAYSPGGFPASDHEVGSVVLDPTP
jgi:ammonium transporter, Amt family